MIYKRFHFLSKQVGCSQRQLKAEFGKCREMAEQNIPTKIVIFLGDQVPSMQAKLIFGVK